MVAQLGDFAGAWFWWIAIVSFVAAILIEAASPERTTDFPAWRWIDHLALYAGCLVLAGVLNPGAYVLGLVPDSRATFFGFIDLVAGRWAVLISGLLLLDLFVYFMHWLQHAVFPLWRVHAVHHSDGAMDASTAMRHHPLAYLQVAVCVTVVFALLGLPLWVFPIYGVILFLAALFQHWNVRVSVRVQRPLGWLLICPNMHRLHHSADPEQFNCNFGNVLSIWDRLFGTLRIPSPAAEEQIVFGLDDAPERTSWLWTWRLPFLMTRPAVPPNRTEVQYWRKS